MFASFFVPMVIAGWDGLLVAGVLRLVWSLNITWCVNSVCHVWGRRAKDAAGNRYLADDSRNNLLIAVLGFGEGNHSNHHAQQAWAFHGWKWYSIDPSKWVIALLEQLQLARDIKKPNLAIVFKQRQLAPPSLPRVPA